jgi:CRP/FNR family transcriptional regulator, dissimilatory nitrate respiration regulator
MRQRPILLTTVMNLHALLNHTDLFGALSDRGKQRIEEIAIPRELKRNETLFLEGERGEEICLLASGGIQLSKSSGNGDKSVIIKSVKIGEIFAEVILFEADRYPVTATAVRASLVYLFPRRRFIGLLENADFRSEFIVMLLRKQRYLTERLRSLVTMDAADKLFHYLRQHYGRQERITPGISKKLLAAAIDMTPETLSRILLKLKNKGTLTWAGGEIILRKGFWEDYYREGEGDASPR